MATAAPSSSDTSNSAQRRFKSDWSSYVGVGVMALLIVVIVVVSAAVMGKIKNAAEVIARDRVEKVILAQQMNRFSRERTVLLQRIVLTEDPFDRDALILEFQSHANQFTMVRAAFIAKGISAEERRLLEAQGDSHREAAPLQDEILDHVTHGRMDQARRVLSEKEKRLQDNTQALMSQLVKYQIDQTQHAIDEASADYDSGMLIIYVVTGIAGITAVILAWLVHRFTLERREYVAQVETANRAKSSFLAKMSHEMRTPLTSVIGFADMSLDSDQTMEERVSALKAIKQSSAHLLRIINDILDLAKIEAQKLDIEKSKTELIPLLNDVHALVQMQARSKGLSFDINFKYPLPRAVETDALRLKQILTNLCGNAIKFTERGFVYLNVSFERDSGTLRLAVEDSGIGLEADEVARLFGEFQQADSSITRKYGGTGLGLAISRRLVQLLGGEISVASSKGTGSTFTLSLPCAERDVEMLLTRDAGTDVPVTLEADRGGFALPRFTGKVLAAEDNAQLRELIRIYLKRAGVDAEIVQNGAEAVARVTQAPFDLVFLDIEMPVMDGVTAITQLRGRNIHVPVIALTANAMPEDHLRYRQAGFNEVLDKPIDRAKFYAVLEAHLIATGTSAPVDHAPIFAEALEGEWDEEMLRISDTFVERLPQYCEQLTRAIATQDWKTAREVVHQLRGLGGAMGYPVITEISSSMQFQIKAENTAEVAQLSTRLNQVTGQIERGRKISRKNMLSNAS